MADNNDPMDYSAYYNTQLSQGDEERFQRWVQRQSERTGRDIGMDLYDYDLRGWWRRNQSANMSDAHLPDTYKKPNHPTFSDESRYHGEDGLHGGTWERQSDGSFIFTPGRTNLAMHDPDYLSRYFERAEPGNRVNFPD